MEKFILHGSSYIYPIETETLTDLQKRQLINYYRNKKQNKTFRKWKEYN